MHDDQMIHLCKMPVGAWGYWGHRRCEYFFIRSNRSLDEIRELHFACFDVLGFEIGRICGSYNEVEVDEEIAAKLRAVNINVPLEPDPGAIFKIWMDILQYIDTRFEYAVIDPPDIAFIGKDIKGRSFDAPGYGVFD